MYLRIFIYFKHIAYVNSTGFILFVKYTRKVITMTWFKTMTSEH